MRRVLLSLLLIAAGAARLDAQWQTITPGEPTVCADGSPFRFFVYPGDPAKLLVEFEGGGACWDDASCGVDIYSRRVQADPGQAEQRGQLVGIYDRRNSENPFRDWTHVYIPYCTGDLHWGSIDKTYSGSAGPFVVPHRGAINATAALSWASENVPAPRQVFVTGCSAGGYGSIFWAPHIFNRYPGAAGVQLADSAAGVVPPGFFTLPLANWNVAAAWPNFIPSLDLGRIDPAQVTLAQVYNAVAGHYPLASFAQFNRTADSNQIFFYILTKGSIATQDEWASQMQASVAALQASNANFFGYTAAGADHCVINSAALYTTQVNGVRLVDWIRQLAESGRTTNVP
jgi:hypothetical protein